MVVPAAEQPVLEASVAFMGQDRSPVAHPVVTQVLELEPLMWCA
jgi:hypothetical protein